MRHAGHKGLTHTKHKTFLYLVIYSIILARELMIGHWALKMSKPPSHRSAVPSFTLLATASMSLNLVSGLMTTSFTPLAINSAMYVIWKGVARYSYNYHHNEPFIKFTCYFECNTARE